MLTKVNWRTGVQYVLGLLFAGMLVAGQACWRAAVHGHTALFAGHEVSAGKVLGFVFAPLTMLGAVLYLLATVLYMFLLSRYNFSVVQGIALAFSLTLSMLIATAIFHEKLTVVNIVGVLLLLCGIALLNMK